MTDYPYDTTGFDLSGYDRNGYDASGFDARGYDRYGYDPRGYDAAGYDRNSYDTDGYDRHGFDTAGYDRAGYDTDGYDRNGYDRRGVSVSGREKTADPTNPVNGEPNRRQTPGDPDVQVSRMIAGGVATVAVGALAAVVVCWALQAIRTGLPVQIWERVEIPRVPDPTVAALLGGVVAAAAAALALALAVFVAEGLRFFRILALLVIVVWIVAVASDQSWPTWLVTTLVVGIPGIAIARLAPSVRPTLRR
jgi:hypothetical protein